MANKSLSVASSDLTSGGSYQCRVRTEMEELGLEHRVEVVERTVFTVSPRHQTGLQGDQLDLSCQVRLDRKFLPDAEIIWRRNRELIITSGRATFH